MVDIAHPYPANVEAMFQRVCHIEALLRNSHPAVATTETTERSTALSPVTSFDAPVTEGNADMAITSDLDDLLRDVMCDDFDGLDGPGLGSSVYS